MFSIAREAVPEDSLLRTYRGGAHPERWGRYGDCFSTQVDRVASLADYVFAFYTSSIFRIERSMLRAFIAAPSSDAQTRALADGSAGSFAVLVCGRSHGDPIADVRSLRTHQILVSRCPIGRRQDLASIRIGCRCCARPSGIRAAAGVSCSVFAIASECCESRPNQSGRPLKGLEFLVSIFAAGRVRGLRSTPTLCGPLWS
jgi:hypothetical protein